MIKSKMDYSMALRHYILDGFSLTSKQLFDLSSDHNNKIALADSARERVNQSHQLLLKFVEEKRVIYGVNTGLGGFVNWLVPLDRAQELQENLIAAVATNVGSYLDDTICKASILARINSLARGNSGISAENLQKLVDVYNSEIYPCIPKQGSLGASGDLGPLAAIALVCIGKWKAKYKGEILPAADALRLAGLEPMKLGFKEGLCLINGTSVMTALAAINLQRAKDLLHSYELISALSFEGLKARKKPFDPAVHELKPHKGQLEVATRLYDLLETSSMIVDENEVEQQLRGLGNVDPTEVGIPIEDAYSIRCTPQILGPLKDTLSWIDTVVQNEINSSNDNPLIVPDLSEVFHNGHFHGQYISMAMDYLSICLTTLSNLSDRRIDRFMDKSNSNGLPPFLCNKDGGLRLGLMGGQFMAASITAENRSLCMPLSIQTLPSTGDFQDIVSMGLIAARRAEEIYQNACKIISFELLCACQSADIRGSEKLSKPTAELHKLVRKHVPFLDSDQSLTDYLEKLSEMLQAGDFLDNCKKKL